VARKARAGLVELLRVFGKADAAYPPAPRAEYAPRYNDYEHLARTAEWTVNQTDEEAGEFG
jgi:ATP-dependent helicase/nuclease subunit B